MRQSTKDMAQRNEFHVHSEAAQGTGNAQPGIDKDRQQSAPAGQYAASSTCQAESLKLLEWPEICQQVS